MKRVMKESLRRGTAQAFRLQAGERVRICTPTGGQVADVTFPCFHQALTRRINGTAVMGRVAVVMSADVGTVFYDGIPAPVLELVENRSRAAHDLLFPGCQRQRPHDPPGCRDLLSEVLSLPLLELPAPCSLFMDVSHGVSVPSRSVPGDFVVLEARREVIIGVTACPGPTANARSGPIDVEVYQP
jgi:uncharacterized protein YcgI (DUF1989 family)